MSEYAQTNSSDVPRVPWWLVLIEGIAAILLGILLFSSPVVTTAFLVQFLGIYWFAMGIFNIVSIFIDRSVWGWKLFSGIVGIIAGVLIFQHPLWSTLIVPGVLVYIVAFSGLFLGLVGLLQAFRGGGWGAGILGALSILFALILLSSPFLATLSVPWVLGILGIGGGILAIFGAFGLRSLQKESAKPVQAAPAPAMQTRAGVVAPAPVTPAPVAETGAATMAAVAVAASAMPEAPTPAAEAPMPVVETTTPEAMAPVITAEMAAESIPGEESFVVPLAEKASDIESEETEVEAPAELSASKFTEDIEYVEGIGPAFGQKLKEAGIFTPKDLLEKGATSKGREEIAELTAISGKLVLEWVNHCDLFRIKGVGSEYADLLEAAGVDTVVELATRNPVNLYLRMGDVNAEKNLVRRVPVQSQVDEWVAQAKLLPRVITY
jgi:uncharacterized membrane protein HdeD (DUF308 family)/predicted flap endonuclease-1-like 5' DNA nuclease